MSFARSRSRVAAGAVAVLSLAVVIGSSPAAIAGPLKPAPLPPGSAQSDRYVVVLADKPLLTYEGGIKGLSATKVSKGRKIDVNSAAAKRYRDYLVKQQRSTAARVSVKPVQSYSLSVNGFTAQMSTQQARALQNAPGVLGVTKEQRLRLNDDKNSVDFLKLTGPTGVWAATGGKSKAGRGVVVGVLDTGVWPESKSFAGAPLGTAPATSSDPYRPYRSGSKIVMNKADGNTFTGTCQAGDEFTADLCNTKLVGARYFSKTYEQLTPPEDRTDYLSPRDGDGHGSHTASTAAGNADVAAVVDGRSFGNISGVAPAAKVAVYKVGFNSADDPEGSIYTGDALDGIDAAILDGVDVINYSISGSDSPVDPVDLAFLSAASAGIFVATSAGNAGPGASTANHTTPWLTTVAASTVAPYAGTVVLGDGRKFAGISTTVTDQVGPAPLVTAAAVKLAAASVATATLCTPDTLDPAKVTGKIVVCDRGVVDRVAKSAEVKRAGGVGMVLVNLTDNSVDGDLHTVPTVHLNVPGSVTVRTYAGTSGATATLVEGNTTTTKIPYPQIAPFSSRGPSLGAGGDLLKPDIAAPGVATLAAVAPPSNSGRSFDFYSGTSMASPHIAGLAALYLGVHPTWSPMTIKSAMMTTASRTRTDTGAENRDAYAQGAGNVRPDRMFNPGVVFNSADDDWLAYLAGQGFDFGTGVEAIDPSDFNSPSIAIGKLLGTQTVTRRVTAVKPGLYRATLSVPGVNASVSPSIVSFTAAGQTKTIKVKFSRATAAFDTAVFGSLYISGAGTQARVPIAVTPRAVAAPETIRGKGASGAVAFQVTPGISGAFAIDASGLQEMDKTAGSLATKTSTAYQTTFGAAQLMQLDLRASSPAADLDLDVYRVVDGEPELVGSSATSSADEKVTLFDTPAGAYIINVTNFSNAPGTTSTGFTLYSGAVTADSDEGDFSVTPASPTASNGKPITVTARWSGVGATTPYLGLIEYVDGSGTVVEVNK
jgi:hypothetical protein